MNEHTLQCQCVQWFRAQHKGLSPMLFAVPNGTIYGTSNKYAYSQYLKNEGVLNGVADLILLKGNGVYNSLCIELKYGKNTQSDKQKSWGKSAEENGNKYAVIYTLNEFINVVNEYLR